MIAVQCFGGQDWLTVKAPNLSTCGSVWPGSFYSVSGHRWSDIAFEFDPQQGSTLSGFFGAGTVGKYAYGAVIFAGTSSAGGDIEAIGIGYKPSGTDVDIVTISGPLNVDGSITGTLSFVFQDGSAEGDTFVLNSPCNSLEHGP